MNNDFGSQLRNARIRQGYDINTVARRLRIRPDVIQSIEESDFERMPPRGYARNMINSYAHLLGLNSSQITRQYLDELYAYQVNQASHDVRGTGFNIPESNRYHHRGTGASGHPREVRRGARTRTEGSERFSHRVYDDGYQPHQTHDYQGDYHHRYGDGAQGRTTHSRGRRAGNVAIGGEGYLNAYKGPTAADSWTANWRNRIPSLAVVIVAVVLVIILLVLLFGPKDSGSTEEVTTMPVTGVESAESASSTSSEQPTSFEFSFTVESGKSVWVECYVDGKTKVAKTVKGPTTKTYTVKKKVELVAGTSDGISAKQDGQNVKLTTTSAGGVDTTLTFSDYLKKWKKQNGASSSSSATSSSASDTSSDSASSGESSSSAA
ncbi:MAG: helix-turn-helix domain-containing protein [Eggerthellaceae bacterium]